MWASLNYSNLYEVVVKLSQRSTCNLVIYSDFLIQLFFLFAKYSWFSCLISNYFASANLSVSDGEFELNLFFFLLLLATAAMEHCSSVPTPLLLQLEREAIPPELFSDPTYYQKFGREVTVSNSHASCNLLWTMYVRTCINNYWFQNSKTDS